MHETKHNPIEPARHAVEQKTESQPIRRYRALLFQLYLVLSIVGFGILAYLVTTTAYFETDVGITRTLQAVRTPAVSELMQLVSWPGYWPQATALVLLLVLPLILLGMHWEAVAAGVTALGANLINLLIKTTIQRPRPSADLVDVFNQLTSYSFPSGHVMFYTAFFGFLFFLAYSQLKPSWQRTLLMILFAAMVVLVGPSRIYLGEHWASDVLAGYLMGSLVLTGALILYRWGKPRFFTDQPVLPPES